jgi:hypothetical protein
MIAPGPEGYGCASSRARNIFNELAAKRLHLVFS